ncbi:MAG: hypothetical protein KUG79_08330 [Pseudomonadales bacterium]|nr:hypothetical protein [Pseudomonadales bacterium]
MTARHTKTILLLSLLFTAISSYGEITYNGFLSVGGGQLIDDDEITSYAGFDGKWKSDPDTVFALQISAPLSDKLKGTAQFIAKGSDSYNVEAEWAYVTYNISDQWDVRAGRLRAPLFSYSDFLDVGYAYPFIRPPTEVYRILFTTITGVDTLYNTSFGNWDANFQFYYGRLDASTFLAGEELFFDLADFTGVNAVFTYDWLSFRATYNLAPKLTIPLPAAARGLLDAIAGSGFPTVAEALDVVDETGAFYGVAMNIDLHDWLLSVEYTEVDFEDQSLFSDDEAWYFLVGKRMGDFTYHITYEYRKQTPDLGFLDGFADDSVIALLGGLPLKPTVLASVRQAENNVLTFGVRYDFTPGASLKVEFADIEFENLNQDGTLISFSVDVVF